jgi:acyl-coenzyme A thioesterase PaaI-like protein
MTAPPPSLFVRNGERFVPTLLARGPWSASALHGGPPAALLARAIERFEGGETMLVTRITLELLRPIPLEPLAVHVKMTRPGRKVQLVEASLHTEAHEVARATGLRIRRTAVRLPPDLPMEPVTVPPPEEGSDATRNFWTAFTRTASNIASFAASSRRRVRPRTGYGYAFRSSKGKSRLL